MIRTNSETTVTIYLTTDEQDNFFQSRDPEDALTALEERVRTYGKRVCEAAKPDCGLTFSAISLGKFTKLTMFCVPDGCTPDDFDDAAQYVSETLVTIPGLETVHSINV